MAISADKRKLIIAITGVVHTVLLSLTLYDLGQRPDAAVRGPKRLWRRWAVLNTTGSIAYWTIGRKRRRGQESKAGPEGIQGPESMPGPESEKAALSE